MLPQYLFFLPTEHIRANFTGGHLTWSFVFTAIGVPEDQNLGREPVSKGLQWWNREIRVLSNGTRMFLYSLMIEGGIPAKLLTTPGLFLKL